MERKRIKVVGSALCSVDLLHHLENEQDDRDDLKRNVLDLRLAFTDRFRRDNAQNDENQNRDRKLIKVCKCPKYHVDLHSDGCTVLIY